MNINQNTATGIHAPSTAISWLEYATDEKLNLLTPISRGALPKAFVPHSYDKRPIYLDPDRLQFNLVNADHFCCLLANLRQTDMLRRVLDDGQSLSGGTFFRRQNRDAFLFAVVHLGQREQQTVDAYSELLLAQLGASISPLGVYLLSGRCRPELIRMLIPFG